MDEAGGFCGLIAIILVLVLGLAAWTWLRPEPDPEPGAGLVEVEGSGHADGNQPHHPSPRAFGRPLMLVLLGCLYLGGLFLVRPRALRAKRDGASDQQAALIALTSFALSPVVVPVHLAWSGLGLLGRALTSGPDPEPRSKPNRGANDLD